MKEMEPRLPEDKERREDSMQHEIPTTDISVEEAERWATHKIASVDNFVFYETKQKDIILIIELPFRRLKRKEEVVEVLRSDIDALENMMKKIEEADKEHKGDSYGVRRVTDRVLHTELYMSIKKYEEVLDALEQSGVK